MYGPCSPMHTSTAADGAAGLILVPMYTVQSLGYSHSESVHSFAATSATRDRAGAEPTSSRPLPSCEFRRRRATVPARAPTSVRMLPLLRQSVHSVP